MLNKIRISKFLNEDYKSYALYTISSRGIPNAYDCLTPGQRLNILYASKTFKKTLSLVGDVLGSGLYHHGDKSIQGTIIKLARSFQSSEPILLGDGFFGNITNHTAASPRYTMVKINPVISEHINKFHHLNEYQSDGVPLPFNVEIPIGLCNLNLGIAVGFATKILPRKIEDVLSYLNGESNKVKPYFKDWNGSVEQFDERPNIWVFKGDLKINKNSIIYKSIPPFMQYGQFMKKVNDLLNIIGFDNVEILNRSTDTIDFELRFKNIDVLNSYQEQLLKLNQMVFTENIVLTSNNSVLEYENLLHYLDQFKIKNNNMMFKHYNYDIDYCEKEMNRLNIMIEFIKFMMGKKRTQIEIDEFINRYDEKIKNNLDSIKLRNLSIEYINKLKDKINDLKQRVSEDKKHLKKLIYNDNFKFSSTKDSSIGGEIETDLEQFQLMEEQEEQEGDEIWD